MTDLIGTDPEMASAPPPGAGAIAAAAGAALPWDGRIYRALFDQRWPMPRYFFDIEEGHRFEDGCGSDFENDTAAIEKAKVVAIGVALDKPAVDPNRNISVLNADRVEISIVPVYSKPA